MFWHETIYEKMKRKYFLRQQRGAIFVLTALMLPVFLGFMGFAYDFGNLYMHKSRLQNVADAAALAGGRAFLESQTETNIAARINDKVDPFPDPDEGRAELQYRMTDDPNTPKSRPDSNHPAADKAADAYIIKNLVNLGTEVRNDKYSHYALNSVENPSSTQPKKFYRIGLYETVPLYFLPVILDRKEEKVRAGAVVLLEKGGISSGDGESENEDVTSPSIFDNLFAFSEWLFTRNNSLADGTINASFSGNMVYTHLNNTSDTPSDNYLSSDNTMLQPTFYYHYETSGINNDTSPYSHMFQDKVGSNVGSSGGMINDPTIDLFYDTKAYLDTFRDKLNGPHIDVSDSPSNKFYITGDGSINVQCLPKQYQLNGTGTYRKDSSANPAIYYALDNNGNDVTFQQNGKTYKDCYCMLGWSNKYVRCGKSDEESKFYLLNNSGSISNCYIDVNSSNPYNIIYTPMISLPQGEKYLGFNWESKLAWGDDKYNLSNYVTIDNLNPKVALPDPVTSDKFTEKPAIDYGSGTSNVYHVLLHKLSDPIQIHDTVEIWINDPILPSSGHNMNEPIYVIVEGVAQVKICGTADMSQGRPVVIAFLSENTIRIMYEYEGKEFKGTIYAPVSIIEHIQHEENSTFRGNIIGKYINIEAGSSIAWVQENHLEKYKYAYYEDPKGEYILDNGIYRLAGKAEKDNPSITKYKKEIVYEYTEDANGDYVREANGRYRKAKEGDTGTRYTRGMPVYDYLDTDIKAVSDSIAQNIEAANQNANLTEELKNEIYTRLELTTDEITAMNSNPNWYNEQSFGRKKRLYANWRSLYDEYRSNPTKSHLVNFLWPWNEHFDIGIGTSEPDTLRIINFRTEFTEGPKDPFIDLSLEDN